MVPTILASLEGKVMPKPLQQSCDWTPRIGTALYFFLEGLRPALRPWGQQNGAPIIADHVPTATALQVREPVGRQHQEQCTKTAADAVLSTTHIKHELEIPRGGKPKKQEQRYDGTKQVM